MSETLLAIFFALLAWWLSTGIILYLNHLPRRTHRWSVLLYTLVLVACFAGIGDSSHDLTPLGAFIAFVQALLIWGWLEMTYLMGFMTGPVRVACPEGISSTQRFIKAIGTSLYHELGVIAAGIAIFMLAGEGNNPVAALTFVTLWIMRWSAKLNLYFGIPNFNEEWFPADKRYLSTYMRKAPMNLLFPVSVTMGTIAAALLVMVAANGDEFTRVGYTLVSTLLILAVVEHWFLVLPVRDSALWQWALPKTTESTGTLLDRNGTGNARQPADVSL